MANQEHLDMLKQGVEIWNQWRQEHPHLRPDLSRIQLIEANLRNANLKQADLLEAGLGGCDLTEANLSEARLTRAHLSGADLIQANLNEANLAGARLDGTHLYQASLNQANLRKANLANATLVSANLREATLDDISLRSANLSDTTLSNASLRGVNLKGTVLSRADFSGVIISATTFIDVDLREVKGLTKIQHEGPSYVELHTVKLPQNNSALHFLRGVGVPDEWLDFYRTTMLSPIQYHSCFISYSSQDDTLAHRLHADLQASGVRCWFAPEDMKIGDKIRSRIDEAIHLQDKLLLLLSEHALASAWVEDEVEAAFEKELRQQREVLFPVRLDEQVMQTSRAWATKLRRTRHIGDFTRWKDPQAYQIAFDRLLRDLKAQP